ncbi:hypothetical protein GGX14DRAFT_578407 [Mycena pura]|uniref:Uncharacterized protein n=1 Tax=Mycena pura TaxID=153505 RepID=A0AAD6XZI4_9AGAR|nr:hypothetical protein GGX14DRAFT_578407 [Mycena pura]
MHPGKPFSQPTPYAHKPPEPSKSRPWDSPSPRWRAGRSGTSCARARSCKSDSPRPYARAAYTAMHGTSAGAARTGAGMYTAGQALWKYGMNSQILRSSSPNHHRICDQCPERSTVSTSPVNSFLPSPEFSSYRALTTTHVYFTATRDTPLTTSIFYSSHSRLSPALTLVFLFLSYSHIPDARPTFSVELRYIPYFFSGAHREGGFFHRTFSGSSTCVHTPYHLPATPPDSSLHVVFHNDSALDPAAPIACLTIAAPPSSRTSFLRVALRLEQAPLSPSPLPRSRSRAPESASTAPPLPRPLSPRQDADHVTIRAETARVSPALIQGNTPSKPRSRRCFVCGKQNTHALSFRFCPRTHTLLRRQLAKLDSGRLVLPNGSPLPMTRHAGGIAGHLISQSNAALRVHEHHTTTAPSIRVLPRSTHSKPRTELRLSPPLPRFEPADHDEPTHDSSSPHAAPLPNSAPSPKRVARRHNPNRTHSPRVFSPCNSCTFRKFHQMLLDLLFDRTMRKSLHESQILRSSSPNHHRVCDQCPERSTVSTSPVNSFLPSPEFSSYRALTTTHVYFTATRDTPLTTSIFYSSRSRLSPALTLVFLFLSYSHIPDARPTFSVELRYIPYFFSACAEGGCARDGGMGRVGCFYSACTEAVVVLAPAPFAGPPAPCSRPARPPAPTYVPCPRTRCHAPALRPRPRSASASAPSSRVRVRAVHIVPAYAPTPAPAHPCALPAPAKAAPTCAPGPAYVPCPRIGALPAYTPCPCTPCPRPRTCIRGLGAGPRAHAGAVADAGMAQGSARARTRAKHVRIRGGEHGRYSVDAGTAQGGRGRVCAVCRHMQALPRRVPHVHVRSRPTFAPAAMRPLRPRTRHTRRARAHDTYVHVPYTPCERPRTPTHWYALYAPCQRRNYVYVLCHAPAPALAPHPPPPAPRPPLCVCRAREPAHVYAPHAHLCPRA